MATWRDGRREWGSRGQEVRERQEHKREKRGQEAPFIGPCIPGYCQVTVGVEIRQNTNIQTLGLYFLLIANSNGESVFIFC